MKKATAKFKYIRISPTKLRRVADLIRGKEVNDVLSMLKNLPHKGAKIMYDAVHSVKHNAINNSKLSDNNDFLLSTILINEGPRIKRFQARARGRVFEIIKRTSHIMIELEKQGDK
ncbi:50S ribosomal protein L22 [Candidatus Marinamargulisbacteria bacterium SCGC AAA071-K20]|nr:50S ribosomal protein L22 [Candidatus Marinamargulisbacteria bacterium SCGC AAA071-K20]